MPPDPHDPSRLPLHRPAEIVPEAPYELVERIRASIVVLGPLLARCGRARVSLPGGDDFGPRPIDMHLRGLEAMGASLELRHGYVEAVADGGLRGASITLEFPSVGATENILMAAVLAKGTTVLDNAAREPEIADLCAFLVAMGARLEGLGTSTLTVHGVTRPTSARSTTVVPDRVEAATYLAAVGVAGGEVELVRARADHMDMLLRKVREMGVVVTDTGTGLLVIAPSRLRSVDVATLPYPGVATDYKPFLATMLAVADGVGIVTENLFAGRFRYVEELARMGADIRTDSHHLVVRGRPRPERPAGAGPRHPGRGGAGGGRPGRGGQTTSSRTRTTSTGATRRSSGSWHRSVPIVRVPRRPVGLRSACRVLLAGPRGPVLGHR